MIVIKFLAGLIVAITVILAILGQVVDIKLPEDQEIEIQPAGASGVVAPPVVQVYKHQGAIACKFEPKVEHPQQFAADHLFAEIRREGDRHVFTTRLAVPASGYTTSFGSMSIAGTQVVAVLSLNKPTGASLEMLDTVSLEQPVRLPPEALTMRVVLKRNFAWGPDAIVCSIPQSGSLAPR